MHEFKIPKMTHHKASDRAVVRLSKQDFYLGPWGSRTARNEYDRRIAEWLANGRHRVVPGSAVTIAQILADFLDHAHDYYRLPDGSPSSEISAFKYAMKPLRRLYGHSSADEFGPLALKVVRQAMTDRQLSTIQNELDWIESGVDKILEICAARSLPQLWTTLEPCPMCAATLCVCRMKRVVYVVPDMKYGGSWDGRFSGGKGLKDTYYAKYDLQYGQLDPAGRGTISRKAAFIYAALLTKIGVLRGAKVLDTLFFDDLHDELKAAFGHFWSISEGDLSAQGTDRDKNLRTLFDLRKLCNMPVLP
jgi:hypothetical protein